MNGMRTSIRDFCTQSGIYIKCPSINIAMIVSLNILKMCPDRASNAVLLLEKFLIERFNISRILDELLSKGLLISELSEQGLSYEKRWLCIVRSRINNALRHAKLWFVAFVEGKASTSNAIKCFIERLEQHFLIVCTNGIYKCFKIIGEELAPIEQCLEIEAYRIMKEYSIEFGALRLKDCINVLTLELGVDKRQAREIISNLARVGLVRLRKGLIYLL